MFLLREPSEDQIRKLLYAQKDAPFSYREVGASREEHAPPGYAVDHNRVRLGEGEEAFVRAVEALRTWEMFDLGWVRLLPPEAPVEVGTVVGVLARHYGFWSINPCRIVYLLEEDGDVRRYGFAYGTLSDHGERGEERFSVEWHGEDNSVYYDLYSFSRPNHPLAGLGNPLARALQRRFIRDSKRAMVLASEVGRR